LPSIIWKEAGSRNKAARRLPRQKERAFISTRHKDKKGILALSSILPSPSPHFGGSWRYEQKFILQLPPKRESIYLHTSQRPKKAGDPCSVLLPSPSKR